MTATRPHPRTEPVASPAGVDGIPGVDGTAAPLRALPRRAATDATRPPGSPIGGGTGVALYEGTIAHRRHGDHPRVFTGPASYVYVDVDAMPGALDRLPLWSARRPAPVRLRRRDYFDGTDRPLGAGVRDLVADRTGRRPTGTVGLLTQPRRAGWLFNPMSTYFCLDADGRTEAIVLEVTNTPWNQRSWYVVAVDPHQPMGPWDFPKTMHVSPFLPMDLTYRLRTGPPGARVALHLEDRRDDQVVLEATLALRRVALDRRRAITSVLRRPLATWQVSAGIYMHAARLVARGVPVVRHPGTPPPPSPGASPP